ncbi:MULTISPECIES: mechanosensitive ion channel family protein [Bradyrhizobium]|uniref:mechanosensitive ion channel family protein n=1 Tax=Bradyrhizobium TaxID=374 RepID=UPI00041B5321|nr:MULTISPECIES: mechanosensitive ion channel domain-containing protein [Bradyrhizobium]UFW46420.1 mechanosensitive ion channel [Bradyrhizobium arachidis]
MMLNFEALKSSLVMYGLEALYAILLLIFGWWLSEAAQRFVFRLLTVTHQVDALVTAFVASLARYAILAVIGIAVLQLFGIQTASLVAVLGAASLAIGLALQGTLSNLAAGVMLLVFRPFRIGHDVEVGGKAGEVRSLSLFMTELKAPDNAQILLPNASVWGQPIINRSAYPATGELKVSFPVPAGPAADAIARCVLQDLRENPNLQSQPTVHVSRVIDITNADRPVVELTMTARVKPSEVDAVKQQVLDRIGALVARSPRQGPADRAREGGSEDVRR